MTGLLGDKTISTLLCVYINTMKIFNYVIIFFVLLCAFPGIPPSAAYENGNYGGVEFKGEEYSREEFQKIIEEKKKEKKKLRSGNAGAEKTGGNPDEEILILDDFSDNYTLNCLGGTLGTWEKDNTDITQKCRYKIVEEDSNRVLKLEYDVDSPRSAYNGYWTNLNSTNLRPYKYLIFKVKGDSACGFSRLFKIELKNSEEVGSYIVSGITDRWQEIKIPLEDMKGITDWNDMRELVIVFEDKRVTAKEGVLYFDDFVFSSPADYYTQRIEEANKFKELRKKEALNIATLDDDKLLDRIQRSTFDFFWNESDPETGLIKDRSAKFSPSSVASVGFGLSVFCVAEQRGWVSREDVYNRILKILKTFKYKVQNEKGFYYHFVDMKTGRRAGKSEASSIDTALFLAGALHAGEHFKGTEIEEMAEELYRKTDWKWMYNKKTGLLRMGWLPETGFLTAEWGMAAEEMIMYILAIGSPTYPVSPDAWHNWKRPVRSRGSETYIYCPGEPVFVYLFSHAWIDFRDRKDEYANYWENSGNAVKSNWQFCLDSSEKYPWYGKLWGLTASDGPGGYRAYGADFGNHDGTIAPYGILSSVVFMPEESLLSTRYMLSEYGERIWTKYGFVSAFNPGKNWFSSDSIGIDQGILFLMIENYRTGSVWKAFMENKNIKKSMMLAGFKDSAEPTDYESLVVLARGKKDVRRLKDAYASKPEGTITIDGILNEWNDSHPIEITQEDSPEFGKATSKNDLSAMAYFMWDDEYLYFAVRVKDDIIIANSVNENIYKEDCVELYIDPDYDLFVWGSKKDYQIGVAPRSIKGSSQVWSWFHEGNPGDNVRVAVRFNEQYRKGEYTIEGAVRWDYLHVVPERGKVLGMSVAVHDIDNDGSPETKLNWSFNKFDSVMLGSLELTD